MLREDLVDLNAFVTVAEERSFTRASVRLGTSQSAISYAVRRLETRLGVRLLNRTTRSVAPTEAGQQLLSTLRSSFEDISQRLDSIGKLQETPTGSIRISSPEHAFKTLLWPKLDTFLRDYPAVNVEVEVDPVGSDIISAGFDAGVRLGEDIAKDMIAVRIGPDIRMAVIASPGYFSSRSLPKTPHDVSSHVCINYRRPMTGRILPWEFVKRGRKVIARVDGPLVLNRPLALVDAAKAGHGLACVPEEYVRGDLANGDLIRVLTDWCPPFPGFHLYYPSRRQTSAALKLLIDALRYVR